MPDWFWKGQFKALYSFQIIDLQKKSFLDFPISQK